MVLLLHRGEASLEEGESQFDQSSSTVEVDMETLFGGGVDGCAGCTGGCDCGPVVFDLDTGTVFEVEAVPRSLLADFFVTGP